MEPSPNRFHESRNTLPSVSHEIDITRRSNFGTQPQVHVGIVVPAHPYHAWPADWLDFLNESCPRTWGSPVRDSVNHVQFLNSHRPLFSVKGADEPRQDVTGHSDKFHVGVVAGLLVSLYPELSATLFSADPYVFDAVRIGFNGPRGRA